MWAALVGYCVICWILALIARNQGCFAPCPGERDVPPHVARLASNLTILSAPVWMLALVPLQLWWEFHNAAVSYRYARLRRRYRIYREYAFKPLNYYHLDPDGRNWFDRCTREFFPLGFQFLGDYQLKEEPVSLIDRFFWHDDGMVLGICSIADAIGRIKAASLISWLADGLCVQTTSLKDPHPDQQPDPDADRLSITYAPNLSNADLYARHVQQVATVAQQRQTEVLVFESSQLEDLVVYDQRLFHRWLHRIGKSTAPPEPALPAPVTCLAPHEMLRLTCNAAGRGTAQSRFSTGEPLIAARD